jgi:hypothetical protein
MTIDMMMARCAGDMAQAVSLLEQRFKAYPRSKSGQTHYAWALQHDNRPRAAQAMLRRIRPERDLGWVVSPDEARPRYWRYQAASWHMLGGYGMELEITDRWRDSSDPDWQEARARALAGLGLEAEGLEMFHSLSAGSLESAAGPVLTMAAEFAAHGHPRMALALAESLLVRLEVEPDSTLSASVAEANLLLGRVNPERRALERVVRSVTDTGSRLRAQARIAVLLADTAVAQRVDSILAGMSSRPLRNPWVRGAQILSRAHIAAGFGRREQAVELLRDATRRGMVYSGTAHAFHADPLLAPLRGYPPFDALLKPDD